VTITEEEIVRSKSSGTTIYTALFDGKRASFCELTDKFDVEYARRKCAEASAMTEAEWQKALKAQCQ